MKKAVAFAAAGTLACTAFLSAPDVQAQENSSEETKASDEVYGLLSAYAHR